MTTEKSKIIRVGSRKSELALIQTKYVISCLQKLYPEVNYEIHTMTTMGDRVLNKSLPKIGEKALFTKDLEDALRTGGVDFVVHSLKDLPTSLPIGMAIGAVLTREDPRDALVLNEQHAGRTLKTLPKGSVIGTSSLRRSAQLARYYPHLQVCDIRGNLNTRLAKLDVAQSKFSGIILAQAGLVRMGWQKRVSQVLEPADMLYAVGQGALAVECRANDDYILDMLAKLCDVNTQCTVLTERSFLKTLGGGCSAPVAVCTKLKRAHPDNQREYNVEITGAVWSLDGKTQIDDKLVTVIELPADSEFDENTNEIIPRKRKKTTSDPETPPSSQTGGEGQLLCNRSPENRCQSCPLKLGSPKIIDDTPTAGSSSFSDIIDIEEMIKIHGDAFKKCPYRLQIEKVLPKSTTSDPAKCPVTGKSAPDPNGNKCPQGGDADTRPIDFNAVPDVMGVCPVLNTEQKIQLGVEMKCPVTGKIQEAVAPSDGSSKCPFAGASSDANEPDDKPIASDNINKCPFLTSNQVKLIEYSEDPTNNAQPDIVDHSDVLYCGMARQVWLAKSDIFAKCEELGRNLAQNLINKGALDVMQCAQKEIHSSIGK